MYCRNNFTVIFALGILFFYGCATTHAPDNWLPETENVPMEIYGSWITVVTLDTINRSFEYCGEFIALDHKNVFVLYDSLYTIQKQFIIKSIVEVDQKKTDEYTLWTLGGCVATVSNGIIAAITAPLWWLTGTSVIMNESYRDYYSTEMPDSVYWNDVNKFTRFPQGLPDNIPSDKIKSKKNY
jgi:hypothetical protein